MDPYRVLGIESGGVDTVKHEIHFELKIADKSPMSFIAEYGPSTQIIGALARMNLELQQVLLASQSMKSVAAEKVASSYVQRDQWQDMVIIQLTNLAGVPYTFAIPPKDAIQIAEQLKTESTKTSQKPGHA